MIHWMSNLTKKRVSFFTFVVIGILILEIIFFGLVFALQPSYRNQIVREVSNHTDSNGLYFDDIYTKSVSLVATYNSVSIHSLLNTTNQINNNSVTNFILSTYDQTTGLFKEKGKPSLEATYAAIGSLSILDRLAEINTTKTKEAILNLQTADSLFRDYSELNSTVIGELDHLFEAVSILDKLYTNQTEYYLAINRTEIGTGLLPLQEQGGFKEGITYNITNMRNAYYVTGIMSKLGPNVAFYENIGFSKPSLEKWIIDLYTEQGFKFHSQSAPSIEATAYAVLSLDRLGYNSSYIYSHFKEGIDYMMNFLNDDYFTDESTNTLDTIHDSLLALGRINILSEKIDSPYISHESQISATVIIGSTLLALLVLIVVSMVQLFKEEESDYYETAMQTCVKAIFESQGKDLSELSFLLGEPISQIVFVFNEEDDTTSTLRAISSNYEFIIIYESVSWLPKKIIKYVKSTSYPLITFDFLDNEVFYKIDEAIIHLKEAK